MLNDFSSQINNIEVQFIDFYNTQTGFIVIITSGTILSCCVLSCIIKRCCFC